MPTNLEERLRRLEDSEREFRTANIQKDLERLERELEEVKKKMISRDEFSPVQKVVYAAIGFLVTAFLGTIYNYITKIGIGGGH